jgi:acyl-CoA reductase-like NAD-dependent aldehyde dehydrogenase
MSDIVCISPIDAKEFARRATASETEIATALSELRSAQKAWAKTPLHERAAILERFLEIMRGQNDDVARELAQQMGRPIRYGGEFRSMNERVRYLIDAAPKALAPQMPFDDREGFIRYVERVPVGVVFVVAPWNYPYLTAVNTIIPALMAGNAVLLKHAAQTILVGERFQKALDQAGLPKGLFRNIVLSHDDTAKILSSGAVNHCTFTGSVEGGRAIERAAAGTFMTTTLELGGKDPAYVRADCDVAFAVENLVDGAFFNSGQSCCGVERIYVHERLYDQFVASFVDLTKQYVLGNPLDEATTMGPMAHKRFADVVRAQVADAVAAGAKSLIDPKSFAANDDATAYLAPQVLIDVDHRMRFMHEETFGPAVGIMKVKDDVEALALMNDCQYGLTASIWTKDIERAEILAHEIESGVVFANRCDYVDPGLVWTGVKDTGKGASVGQLGYDGITRPRAIHLKQIT